MTSPLAVSDKPSRGTHTPGPWVVQRDSGLRQRIQTGGDKGTLCYMTARPFAHGANFTHAQITANARLIAAAPELLEALEECLREHGGFTIKGEVEKRARAAIAKARGSK
jgi:hypothetical protein